MAKSMVCELINEIVSKTSTASSSMSPLEEKQEQ
jgi:hypothetical protein